MKYPSLSDMPGKGWFEDQVRQAADALYRGGEAVGRGVYSANEGLLDATQGNVGWRGWGAPTQWIKDVLSPSLVRNTEVDGKGNSPYTPPSTYEHRNTVERPKEKASYNFTTPPKESSIDSNYNQNIAANNTAGTSVAWPYSPLNENAANSDIPGNNLLYNMNEMRRKMSDMIDYGKTWGHGMSAKEAAMWASGMDSMAKSISGLSGMTHLGDPVPKAQASYYDAQARNLKDKDDIARRSLDMQEPYYRAHTNLFNAQAQNMMNPQNRIDKDVLLAREKNVMDILSKLEPTSPLGMAWMQHQKKLPQNADQLQEFMKFITPVVNLLSKEEKEPRFNSKDDMVKYLKKSKPGLPDATYQEFANRYFGGK